MFAASPRTTPVTRVLLVLATLAALVVGHLPAASAVGVVPVMRVDPTASTPSGPAWLVTKNAMTTGPERTALIDLLERQINRQQAGDIIRLTTWSFYTQRVADALVAAKRRGVTVRVVVDQGTWRTAAVRSLRSALGTSAAKNSYIVAPYEKSTHTKVATFTHDKTVLISSANVSDPRQWNHTVVLQNASLHKQTSAWADKLGAGRGLVYTRVATPGVVLHFYPGTVDPVLRAIRNANGRQITIQMSIWKGTRGNQVAKALIEAHQQGSPIAINTGQRWSDAVRAVAAAGIDVFDTRKATGGRAFTHDKLLVVGDEVYTGSTNWGALPRTFSEVVAHISSPQLAAQLRDYVSRTRQQAGGEPILSLPDPSPFAVEPSPGGTEASWSAADAAALDGLTSFEVSVVRAEATGRTVVARQSIEPVTNGVGGIDPVALLGASFTGLEGGVPVSVELTPMGTGGALGATQSLPVVPYLSRPAAPKAVSADPVAPRRALVTFAPSEQEYEPPLKTYEVWWSSDRRRSWNSVSTAAPRVVLSGLPRDVRTVVRVREVPKVGTPSEFSPVDAVRPSRKPDIPADVSLRPRRPGVLAVRWQPPTYTGRGAITAWVVRSRVDDGSWSRLRVRDGDATRAVLRRLPTAGELDVQVAAVNRHGRSPFTRITSIDLRSL